MESFPSVATLNQMFLVLRITFTASGSLCWNGNSANHGGPRHITLFSWEQKGLAGEMAHDSAREHLFLTFFFPRVNIHFDLRKRCYCNDLRFFRANGSFCKSHTYLPSEYYFILIVLKKSIFIFFFPHRMPHTKAETWKN